MSFSGARYRLLALAVMVASCNEPPKFVPMDGGPDAKDGSARDGGAGSGGGSASGGAGGAPIGSGGSADASGGASGGAGAAGGAVTATGGAGGAVVGSGGAVVGSGGAAGAGGRIASSGGAGGANAGSGGRAGTGGAATGGAASGGAGGTPCTGATKACNGACIPSADCCGGCTGNRPVCSNGTCVGRSNGASCSTGTECTSGACHDGVCCNAVCDGQCESCSTAANRGTCVPVTTPRTACAGTGTCGGSCDGTTANRKMCVYPGNTTSCGAAAACASNRATTAALCNGAGACTTPTSMSCTFGCRTDGVPACATSCPSGQGLCGGSCVDVQSSDAHCGASCQACGGATPRCFSGSCVRCLDAVDCGPTYGSGSFCTSSHTCACRPSHTSNIMKNPGFEDPLMLASWSTDVGSTNVSFSTDDFDACPDSGSVRINRGTPTVTGSPIRQCVPVVGGRAYFFGTKFKQLVDPGQQESALLCSIIAYGGANCGDPMLNFHWLSLPQTPATSWSWDSASFTPSEGAVSARVECGAALSRSSLWIDQVYLNPMVDRY